MVKSSNFFFSVQDRSDSCYYILVTYVHLLLFFKHITFLTNAFLMQSKVLIIVSTVLFSTFKTFNLWLAGVENPNKKPRKQIVNEENVEDERR